eukprot:scaffold975_cov394-Pavlova_lutheri.AAC.34
MYGAKSYAEAVGYNNVSVGEPKILVRIQYPVNLRVPPEGSSTGEGRRRLGSPNVGYRSKCSRL